MRAFVGPSESLLSICRFSGRFSLSSFESKLPYSVTVGGLAVNINMSSSTFELDINLYLSAIYDKPSLTSSTPIRCVFDDSPRWKNHKPMPYNSCQGFVVVTGNLTGFILSKADASGQWTSINWTFHFDNSGCLFYGCCASEEESAIESSSHEYLGLWVVFCSIFVFTLILTLIMRSTWNT